ncbi:MAG: divalent-cation tolerance protein CutA [Proteobacteria bacterium]|nr:divalent-cation tolerance protein CutA [Pseudomonadota bacterium]
MQAAELIAVYTTVADDAAAQALARDAVAARLAACVQIEPIHSVYAWGGAIQSEPEQRLVFKTTRAMYAELEHFILQRHPYELPAVHAVPVALASPAYAAWVAQAVRVSGAVPETP